MLAAYSKSCAKLEAEGAKCAKFVEQFNSLCAEHETMVEKYRTELSKNRMSLTLKVSYAGQACKVLEEECRAMRVNMFATVDPADKAYLFEQLMKD